MGNEIINNVVSRRDFLREAAKGGLAAASLLVNKEIFAQESNDDKQVVNAPIDPFKGIARVEQAAYLIRNAEIDPKKFKYEYLNDTEATPYYKVKAEVLFPEGNAKTYKVEYVESHVEGKKEVPTLLTIIKPDGKEWELTDADKGGSQAVPLSFKYHTDYNHKANKAEVDQVLQILNQIDAYDIEGSQETNRLQTNKYDIQRTVSAFLAKVDDKTYLIDIHQPLDPEAEKTSEANSLKHYKKIQTRLVKPGKEQDVADLLAKPRSEEDKPWSRDKGMRTLLENENGFHNIIVRSEDIKSIKEDVRKAFGLAFN